MKKQMFSVFDSVVETFNAPFCAANEAEAKRMITGSMSDQSLLFENAGDYTVFYVGDFDLESGVVSPIEPRHVCRVSELRALAVRQKEEQVDWVGSQ